MHTVYNDIIIQIISPGSVIFHSFLHIILYTHAMLPFLSITNLNALISTLNVPFVIESYSIKYVWRGLLLSNLHAEPAITYNTLINIRLTNVAIAVIITSC